MITTTTSPGLPRSRVITAVIFAVVAVVFIFGGVAIGYAPSLVPHVLVSGITGPSSAAGHHPLRVTAAVIVGLAFAVAAVFALKGKNSGSSGSSGLSGPSTSPKA